jgi:hypothetical protein
MNGKNGLFNRVKVKKKYLFLVTALIFNFHYKITAQTLSNIVIIPNLKSVDINYDLEGNGVYDVKLFYSDNQGINWKGPLKYVKGNVGPGQTRGMVKKVIWSASDEQVELDGLIQFKIIAEYQNTSGTTYEMKSDIPNIKLAGKLLSYRRKKTFWGVTMLISGGAAGYAILNSSSLYDKYKIATLDASKIRTEIETMSMASNIALGIAGFSLLEYIIQSANYSKEKSKKITINFAPKPSGLMLGVSYDFSINKNYHKTKL